MKILLALASVFVLASPAQPQENPAPAAPPPAQAPAAAPAKPAAAPDSPLVAAAKKAKGGRIKPGTMITNENMKAVKGAGGVLTFASPADPNAPAYTPESGAAAAAGRTEEDWRKLVSSAHGAVANAESLIAALRSKTAKLENDFYSWDDPAYRDGVIKPAWDQAQADLEAAKQSLETAKQRITDLEEEARKAGTPPGWLR